MEQGKAWQVVASYFERWYAEFLRYAYGMTGDLALSEDLVQEVYFRLYLQLRRGKVIERPQGWIFCVLRREIGKQRRKLRKYEGRHQAFESIELSGGDPLVDLRFPDVAPDRTNYLGQLLEVLTTREREVVMMRIAALKYREIAQILGISASSVNTLLARAIRKLRKAASKRNLKFSEILG